MQKLEPPDTHYLSAASGWLGLGNIAEAKAELKCVSPEQQGHPDVLEVRFALCAGEQRWEDALAAARQLVERAPKRSSGWLHQAYALRRVANGGLQQAWESLLPAVEQFPKEPVIAFNLACYACQLQRLDEAREWLRRAIKAGGRMEIRSMALADSDLQPLWNEIEKF